MTALIQLVAFVLLLILVILQIPIPFLSMGWTQFVCAFMGMSFMGTMYKGRSTLNTYGQWMMAHDMRVIAQGEHFVLIHNGKTQILRSTSYDFALEEAYEIAS